MPPFETLIAFTLASAIFAYMPGPAMLYATAQTLARGRRAGLMAALGIHVGGYVHVLGATFGVTAVFQLVPPLYLALKLAGAAYLVWLGAQMIMTRNGAPGPIVHRTHNPVRAFRQSVTVEVLNPKTALFFVAFLPQFADPSASLPLWAQLLILGAVVNLIFSSADLVFVVLAHQIKQALGKANRATARVKALGGSILIGLGLTVAFDR